MYFYDQIFRGSFIIHSVMVCKDGLTGYRYLFLGQTGIVPLFFQAFSTPWFLYASPTNHHLVFFLLEVFNNIIQYQFDGIYHNFLSLFLKGQIHIHSSSLLVLFTAMLYICMLQEIVISSTQSFAKEMYSISWQTYPLSMLQLQRPSVRGVRSLYS